jgi:class 3 adenylate cyclase
MCSVLFLDIVEYSQRVVSEQIRLKDRFNAVLTEAITGVPTDERIILDTGDGAAVNFLGDPEDAMFAGLSLRDSVAGQDLTGGPKLQVRIGINIGPVKLVKDINGQPNIIGDGINVAQRVMNFAEKGQILVSRDYYNVMVRLSEDYAQLFHYEGAKTDKHVREHEVYAISAAPSTLRRTTPLPVPKPVRRLPSLRLPTIRLPALRIPGMTGMNLRSLASLLAVNSKLLVAAPLAFILIVSSGVIARSHRNSPGEEKGAVPVPSGTARVEQSPLKVAAVGTDPVQAGQGRTAPVQNSVTAPKSESPTGSGKAQRPVANVRPRDAGSTQDAIPADRARIPVQTARAKDVAEVPALHREAESPVAPRAPAADTAINVVIVAFPWAEIYVDGSRLGVSPPLRSIPLRPGKHRVELRNSSFPAHVETVDVKSGAEISVKHRFRR